MSKKLIPLGNNILVKGFIKKTVIELAGEAGKKATIEKLVVHRIGKDVERLKEGDEILVSESQMFIKTANGIRQNPDVFISNKLEDPDNEFIWMVIRDNDVQLKIN
jgi:hypothetical protein